MIHVASNWWPSGKAVLQPWSATSAGTVQFQATRLTVGEGVGVARLTLARSGGSGGTVRVYYRIVAGNATAGADYVAAAHDAHVTMAGGETTKTINVTIKDDSVYEEGTEVFSVQLLRTCDGALRGGVYEATVVIGENDACGLEHVAVRGVCTSVTWPWYYVSVNKTSAYAPFGYGRYGIICAHWH